jgi:hypothetical protein
LKAARKAYLNLFDELLQLHVQHDKVQGEITTIQERIREPRRPRIASLPSVRTAHLAITVEELKTRGKDKGAHLVD